MQAVLEKPLGVDETQLAPAATETVADRIPAAAEAAPPMVPPVPGGLYLWTVAKQSGKTSWTAANGFTASEVLQAGHEWRAPIEGVPGTGEPDTHMAGMGMRTGGIITVVEVADFLDWCAERIRRFGWVQKTEVYNNRTCAIGAIRLRSEQARSYMGAARADNLYETAGRYLRHYLKGEPIEDWNDRMGRTMEEVIAAFRGAATMLRGLNGAPA